MGSVSESEGVAGLDRQFTVLCEFLEGATKAEIPRSGVLLWGPPGVGKTLLVRAVARATQFFLVRITVPELQCIHSAADLQAYLQTAFQKAEAHAPAVLFIDDIDCSITSHCDARLMAHVLMEMKRAIATTKGVVFLGATNRPDVMDPGLVSPGLLDRLVYVSVPDEAARTAILQATLRNWPLSNAFDVPFLATQSNGFTGADIAEVCQRAAKIGIAEQLEKEAATDSSQQKQQQEELSDVPLIMSKHFDAALRLARPSLSPSNLAQYEAFAASNRHVSL